MDIIRGVLDYRMKRNGTSYNICTSLILGPIKPCCFQHDQDPRLTDDNYDMCLVIHRSNI
jgi:hypothetical protein